MKRLKKKQTSVRGGGSGFVKSLSRLFLSPFSLPLLLQ